MCDIVNNIDLATYSRLFKVDKFVYIPRFIRETTRLKILKTITDSENAHKKINENSVLTALGQLNATNNGKEHTIFKQHSVITGTDIQLHYPELHYYYHNCLADVVSKIVGRKVYPVNERYNTNNALFIYERKGDSLRWHTDGSLFNGKKVFTLLIYVYNSSTQNLCYINHDKEKRCLYTDESSAVILEHFTLEHAVTPLQENEKKILWTMTFAEDMNIHEPLSYIKDKVKNISYLGWDALSKTDVLIMILSWYTWRGGPI